MNKTRRIIASIVIAASMLGVLGATVAGAQSQPAHKAYTVSNWHFNLAFGHAKRLWDAELKQASNGILRGTADPNVGDCRAKVTGRVSGSAIRMTWRMSAPCKAETVRIKGKISGNQITGTVRDSIQGVGIFVAKPDA